MSSSWLDTVSVILNGVTSLLIPLVGYSLSVLRDIRDQLRKLNGRVIRIEQWQVDHDKTDNVQFNRIDDRMDRVERKLDK